jgi:hypothetical protein
MAELCSLSRLDEEQVRAIQNLEKTLGKRLLAYACHDVELASLTEEEIKRINSLQKELGLLLVAVE